MTAKTAFCLLLTLFVVQTARADIDIEEILKDPSILIDELKEKIQEVEDDLKHGAEDLLAKAKNVFADIQHKIEEEVAKGSAAAQCLLANGDELSSLAKVGEQDVTACVNKAITDLSPLVSEVEVTVKDILALAAECGSGNFASISLCVLKNAGDVGTVVKDITNAVEDIPSTYTALKSDIESCDTKLSADVKQIEAIVDTCM